MEFTFRPISTWPGQLRGANARKKSQFKAGYNDTLALLDAELLKLRARDLVLEVALAAADIRLDGRPRSGSVPAHPGVILSFESKHGPLRYPCDCFDRWEDNLRAIALSLEHLRAVDRYGVTRAGEQYRGWAQLPAPPATMSRTQAAAFLYRWRTEDPSDTKGAYRKAAMELHPDRGGDSEQFKKLQEAKEVLGL